MSTHSIPLVDSPTEGITGLRAAVAAAIRDPSGTAINGANVDYTFAVDLTANEIATLGDLLTMHRFGISASLTLAEFQAVKGDLATARAFVGIASPTNAQVVAALKSTIRVVGALLRQ